MLGDFKTRVSSQTATSRATKASTNVSHRLLDAHSFVSLKIAARARARMRSFLLYSSSPDTLAMSASTCSTSSARLSLNKTYRYTNHVE